MVIELCSRCVGGRDLQGPEASAVCRIYSL